MSGCKDPRLTFLNDLGYNVVRLPSKRVVPLGIIGRDNQSRNWLGSLDKVWRSSTAVPVPGAPQEVASIKGTKTSDLNLSVGLDILANALSGLMGSTAPSLSTQYKNAKSLQFVFKDVQSVGVDAFEIGNYLAEGTLASNPVVKRFFSGIRGVDALIVTEVLRARSIGVVGKRDGGTTVEIDVPAIKAAVDANVAVSASSTSQNEVIYEGSEYLSFGFKALKLNFIGGAWTVEGVDPGASVAFGVPGPRSFAVDADELVVFNVPAEAGTR